MSKRNIVLLAVALVLALSVTALAVMPESSTAQMVRGTHQLGVIKSYNFKPVFHDPNCPGPTPPGC